MEESVISWSFPSRNEIQRALLAMVRSSDIIPKYSEWRNPDKMVTILYYIFLPLWIPIYIPLLGPSGLEFWKGGDEKFSLSWVMKEPGVNLRALYKDTTGPGKSLANKGLWMPRDKIDTGQYEYVFMAPQQPRRTAKREWALKTPCFWG